MKKFLSLALALCLAVSMAACGGSASSSAAASDTASAAVSGSAASAGAIKIGVSGPLTGSAAQYGEGVANGVQLAVEEINAMGGIQFEYRAEDDVADPESAVNAYNTLMDWGMQLFAGTVTSDACIAAAELANEDNVFMMTPSATAVEAIAYPNAFRMCFSDPNQGAASAQYIGDHQLATKVAVIYDSSSTYSSGIYENFAAAAADNGFEIVAAEAFTSDSNQDFSVQLQAAQSAGAELVFLPIYYSEASLILSQANTMGYAPQFFGCDGLDGILNAENFDTSLAEGVLLLTPYVPGVDEVTTEFTEKYTEKFGIAPNQFAANAYDVVYAMKAACEAAGVTADMSASDICDAILGVIGDVEISGVTGASISWDAESGEPNKEPRAVVIRDGAYTAPNDAADAQEAPAEDASSVAAESVSEAA